MNVGDTFFGLDHRGHLWIVLTSPNPQGEVVLVSLTTHDAPRRAFCDKRCVIIQPGEHPYPRHDSCVFYRDAFLTDTQLLRRGVDNRTYRVGDPLTAELLERVRQGALDSELTSPDVRRAVRSDAP